LKTRSPALHLPTAAAAPLPVGDGGPDGFLNDNG
jgi:hypothetical protein